MDMDTVDAIGRHVLNNPLAGPEIALIWHAGEPMTVPRDWYEEAFARLARVADGRTFRHNFQTNGVLINDAWIDLFTRWDVRLGVSIDGPKELHDRYRRTRRGGGSFDAVMRGISRLQTRGYPFHVISVLTAQSMADPDRMIDFYIDAGLRDVCFNIEEAEGAHLNSTLSGVGMEQRYQHFIGRVHDRISHEATAFNCREIDTVHWLAMMPKSARGLNSQVDPLAILTIGVDGSMSTFSPELLGTDAPEYNDFAFANVHHAGPEAILSNPEFIRLTNEINAGVEKCQSTCGYFDVCGGGAPANKYFEHGTCDSTETLYCRLTKKVTIDTILEAMEKDATAV